MNLKDLGGEIFFFSFLFLIFSFHMTKKDDFFFLFVLMEKKHKLILHECQIMLEILQKILHFSAKSQRSAFLLTVAASVSFC